jgi:hypothetical protein
MKTKWIIQKNLCTDNFDSIIKSLKKFELPYDVIDIIPFSETLDYDDLYDGPIVAYGSTSFMRLAPKSWKPGVWYDEITFKPSYWGSHYINKYLNNNYKIMPLREVLDNWRYGRSRQFIRPDSDLKLFSGDVFTKGDFKEWYNRVKNLIETGTYVNLTLDTLVSVAPYKAIDKEWRFFIADNEILSASQYRSMGLLTTSICIEDGAYALAYKIAQADWQLSPAYVVDIARVGVKYQIIEFNNFNSSGFYLCNIDDIIEGASRLAEKEFDIKVSFGGIN